MSVDLSYRSSGICSMSIDNGEISYELNNYKNPEMGSVGFQSLKKMSENIEALLNFLNYTSGRYKHDIVIVEMPCFTQSAKSAIVVGMLWGMISQFDCVCVEPSALKKWSGSKKGDKKLLVKERVVERTHLPPHILSNDDMIDAIGLAFMMNDKIREQKYHAKTN